MLESSASSTPPGTDCIVELNEEVGLVIDCNAVVRLADLLESSNGLFLSLLSLINLLLGNYTHAFQVSYLSFEKF